LAGGVAHRKKSQDLLGCNQRNGLAVKMKNLADNSSVAVRWIDDSH